MAKTSARIRYIWKVYAYSGSRRHGRSILAVGADERVRDVHLTEDTLTVDIMDGRTLSIPLAWFPRLLNASSEARNHWQIAGGGHGIHWPDLDEDVSVEGLLRGAPAPKPTLSK